MYDDIIGHIDENGDIHRVYSSDSGGGSIVTVIIAYVLCIIGGVIMLTNVVESAPICIVPAVLGFIVLLMPIIYILFKLVKKEEVSFLGFLIKAVDYSNYVLLIILVSWWTMFFSQTVSDVILMIISFSLMYFVVLSIMSVWRKTKALIAIFVCLVPSILIYLIVLGVSEDYQIWYLMLIPTYIIVSSITVLSIKNFNKSLLSKICLIFIVLAIVFEACFAVTVTHNYTKELEEARVLIEQGEYQKARVILQKNTKDEAKELYTKIRYNDVKKGDVIYNGYFSSSDEKTIDDQGISFTCVKVENNVAYFISNDIIFLESVPTYYLGFDYAKSKMESFDITNLVSIDEDNKYYFSIPTLEFFNTYKDDEIVKNAIFNYNISKSLKNDAKKILSDDTSYAWGGKGNQVAMNSWFLYDEVQKKFYQVNQNNEVDSNNIYSSYYHGVRICYKVKLQ